MTPVLRRSELFTLTEGGQLRRSRAWGSGLQPLKLQGLKALFKRGFLSDLKVGPPTLQAACRPAEGGGGGRVYVIGRSKIENANSRLNHAGHSAKS